MDKLRAMRTFMAIADAGSLTAAARALGGSLPAVVRLLAALEAELGTRLLQRTTRRIALTEAGRRYLERCRQVATLIDEAEAEVRSEQTEPRGRLVVTAPVLFGTRHVASGVTVFLQRYPDVHVDFQLLDRMVNLVEEGVDVGVRIGTLDDSTLIARHVGEMRRVTVAAPSYLARRDAPWSSCSRASSRRRGRFMWSIQKRVWCLRARACSSTSSCATSRPSRAPGGCQSRKIA